MHTTNSKQEMASLGINAAMIGNYSEVSREPLSFKHEESLGWGDVYRASHAAIWNLWADTEQGGIRVNGRAVMVANDEPQEFEDLLYKWRLAVEDTRPHGS